MTEPSLCIWSIHGLVQEGTSGQGLLPYGGMPEDVRIRGDMIRLGPLLKLAGVVDAGSDVRMLLAEGGVLVNGEPEARRGRQLHPGDVVSVGDHSLRVTAG